MSLQPGSGMHRLMSALAEQAAEARPLRHIERDLEPLVGEPGYVIRRLLARAVAEGRVALQHEGRAITAIMDPRGAWRIGVAPQPKPPGERLCLRCRKPFAPRHRTKFMCQPCALEG